LEVLNQFIPNVVIEFILVNYSELSSYSICSQHFIKLTDLIAKVSDLFSVER